MANSRTGGIRRKLKTLEIKRQQMDDYELWAECPEVAGFGEAPQQAIFRFEAIPLWSQWNCLLLYGNLESGVLHIT